MKREKVVSIRVTQQFLLVRTGARTRENTTLDEKKKKKANSLKRKKQPNGKSSGRRETQGDTSSSSGACGGDLLAPLEEYRIIIIISPALGVGTTRRLSVRFINTPHPKPSRAHAHPRSITLSSASIIHHHLPIIYRCLFFFLRFALLLFIIIDNKSNVELAEFFSQDSLYIFIIFISFVLRVYFSNFIWIKKMCFSALIGIWFIHSWGQESRVRVQVRKT